MAETEYVLTGDTKQLVQALDEVTAALKDVAEQGKKTEEETKKTQKAGIDMGKAFNIAAAGALAVGAGLAKMTAEVMKTRTAVLRLSSATGIGTDTIAGLEVAVERMGGNSEEVTDQLQDFNEKLFDFANTGSGAAAEAFQLLGIRQEELRDGTLSVDDALKRVLTELPKLQNEAEKGAAAQQLFSDRGLDFANALEAMPLEQSTALARAYGRVVDEEAAESTAKWNRALADLSGAVNSTKLAIVDWLDPAAKLEGFLVGSVAVSAAVSQGFSILERAVTGTIAGYRALLSLDVAGYMKEVREALTFMGAAWDEGFIDPAVNAAREFHEARSALDGVTDAADDFVGPVQAAGGAMKDLKDQQDKAKAAADKHAAKLKEQQSALEELRQIGFEAGLDTVGGIEKILIARDQQIARLDELAVTAGSTAEAAAEAEVSRLEVIAAAEREITALRIEQTQLDLDAVFAAEDAEQEKQRETTMAHGAAMAEQTEQRKKDTEEQKLMMQQLSDIGLSGIARMSAAWSQLSEIRLQGTEDELSAVRTAINAQEKMEGRFSRRRLRELKKKEAALKHQAQRAWSIQQGLAVTGIAADTALAVMRAFAMFGPPPSPVGIASAATAGLLGGVQTAAVLSQKMPTFHLGTDEISATLRLGEAVLTPAAADSLGRDRIDDLNRQAAGATGNTGAMVEREPVSFAAVFRDRVLDQMMTGVLDTGGTFATAIAPTAAFGQVDPYGANG